MVDGGGWWWMVDGSGGWSKKRFSDFAETLHIDSTRKCIFYFLDFWRDNSLVGLKSTFSLKCLEFLLKFPTGWLHFFS